MTEPSAEKLTERLRLLLQQRASDVVAIKIRLSATPEPARLKKIVSAVSAKLTNPEYIGVSGTIHGTINANGVSALAAIEGVESVDLERSVPVTELMDPESPAAP